MNNTFKTAEGVVATGIDTYGGLTPIISIMNSIANQGLLPGKDLVFYLPQDQIKLLREFTHPRINLIPRPELNFFALIDKMYTDLNEQSMFRFLLSFMEAIQEVRSGLTNLVKDISAETQGYFGIVNPVAVLAYSRFLMDLDKVLIVGPNIWNEKGIRPSFAGDVRYDKYKIPLSNDQLSFLLNNVVSAKLEVDQRNPVRPASLPSIFLKPTEAYKEIQEVYRKSMRLYQIHPKLVGIDPSELPTGALMYGIPKLHSTSELPNELSYFIERNRHKKIIAITPGSANISSTSHALLEELSKQVGDEYCAVVVTGHRRDFALSESARKDILVLDKLDYWLISKETGFSGVITSGSNAAAPIFMFNALPSIIIPGFPDQQSNVVSVLQKAAGDVIENKFFKPDKDGVIDHEYAASVIKSKLDYITSKEIANNAQALKELLIGPDESQAILDQQVRKFMGIEG